MVFQGYHGTDLAIRDKIIQQGFLPSATGWLGTGIYFYEDDPYMARKIASKKYHRVGVLQCQITLPDISKCLDLTNPKQQCNRVYHALRDSIIKRILSERNLKIVSAKGNNPEDFDNTTCNMLCSSKGYVMVRAHTYTYTKEDSAIQQYSRIPNGIELCLRDSAYIESMTYV